MGLGEMFMLVGYLVVGVVIWRTEGLPKKVTDWFLFLVVTATLGSMLGAVLGEVYKLVFAMT